MSSSSSSLVQRELDRWDALVARVHGLSDALSGTLTDADATAARLARTAPDVTALAPEDAARGYMPPVTGRVARATLATPEPVLALTEDVLRRASHQLQTIYAANVRGAVAALAAPLLHAPPTASPPRSRAHSRSGSRASDPLASGGAASALIAATPVLPATANTHAADRSHDGGSDGDDAIEAAVDADDEQVATFIGRLSPAPTSAFAASTQPRSDGDVDVAAAADAAVATGASAASAPSNAAPIATIAAPAATAAADVIEVHVGSAARGRHASSAAATAAAAYSLDVVVADAGSSPSPQQQQQQQRARVHVGSGASAFAVTDALLRALQLPRSWREHLSALLHGEMLRAAAKQSARASDATARAPRTGPGAAWGAAGKVIRLTAPPGAAAAAAAAKASSPPKTKSAASPAPPPSLARPRSATGSRQPPAASSSSSSSPSPSSSSVRTTPRKGATPRRPDSAAAGARPQSSPASGRPATAGSSSKPTPSRVGSGSSGSSSRPGSASKQPTHPPSSLRTPVRRPASGATATPTPKLLVSSVTKRS